MTVDRSENPITDSTRCVCGHEKRLHAMEPGGLCIRDEWCLCPGFMPDGYCPICGGTEGVCKPGCKNEDVL